jgi:hypothetical protein
MYSRRQKTLVQLVLSAAEEGRFCYQSGTTWVIVKKGYTDMVLQIDFGTATSVYLNALDAWSVIRANPPHHSTRTAQQLEALLDLHTI